MKLLRTLCLALLATTSPLVSPVGQTPAAGSAGGQRPGPPGTIRVRVRLIPVDVIAADQQNRPVANLKQEDFQIFENGQEQQIRHFSVEKLSASPAESAQPAELRKVPTLELAPRSSRTFLILLGRGRHQTYFKCIDDLIRFVRRNLLPQDRVAVFCYNRATDFTTEHERVAQVLDRYKKANEKLESQLESRLSGLAAIYGSKEIPKSLQSEIDAIFAGPETPASRRVPPAGIPNKTGWDKKTRDVAGQANRTDEAAAISQFDKSEADSISGGLSFDEFASSSAMTQQDVRNILTCVEYLRYMEGEKHLLFFTEKGLFFPRGDTKYDMWLAAVANDARVAIDVFQTGGIPPPRMSILRGAPRMEIGPDGRVVMVMPDPPPFSQPNPAAETYGIQSIRTVAELTGGRTAVFSDVGRALSLVNETTRIQYLLGYYPKDDTWDGKYRKIQVKVRRPGLKLSYRHGYLARDTIQPYDREEFLAYSRISAAAGFEFDIDDIPFRIVTAAAKDAAGQPQVKIDLLIDSARVGFVTMDGRHTARLRIAIFALEGNGDFLGEDWKVMDLRLQEDTYRQFLQSGIPFSAFVPLIQPRQMLKIIVYDPGSDKVGSRLARKIG
jgi:VWFA-related protein